MSGADDRDSGREPDPDLLAAEYVLGTLDPRERAEMARAVVVDPATAGRVRAWEMRLAPLADAVPAVAPPPRVRAALLRAIPGPASSESARQDPAAQDPATQVSAIRDLARRETARRDPGPPDQLAALRRQVRRWRSAAAGASLLAAGLALFVAVGTGPRGGAAVDAGRYLAVVQGGGALPALIVRVDLRTGTAQVRPVGAETPAGRSLELWYIGAAGPQAIGLVGAAPSRISLPQGATRDGVIAVTVEPAGGSPNGVPTGPAVYTGKLIAEE